MHPDWARSVRDQCAKAGIAFLFKQWGEFVPTGRSKGIIPGEIHVGEPDADGMRQGMRRIGKKAAGRELDGVTHDDYPEVTR
jgi:protein gp37